MQPPTLNQIVALLGLVLAVSFNLALRRFGFPEKICWGASILAILITSIFWSTVQLGADDDED